MFISAAVCPNLGRSAAAARSRACRSGRTAPGALVASREVNQPVSSRRFEEQKGPHCRHNGRPQFPTNVLIEKPVRLLP